MYILITSSHVLKIIINALCIAFKRILLSLWSARWIARCHLQIINGKTSTFQPWRERTKHIIIQLGHNFLLHLAILAIIVFDHSADHSHMNKTLKHWNIYKYKYKYCFILTDPSLKLQREGNIKRIKNCCRKRKLRVCELYNETRITY